MAPSTMASVCAAAAIGFSAPAFVAPMISRGSSAPATAQGAQLRSSAESAQPASLSALAVGAIIGAGAVLTRRRQTKMQRRIFLDGSIENLNKNDFNQAKAYDEFEHLPLPNWKTGVWVDNEGGEECDAGWVDTEGGYAFLAGEKIPGSKETPIRAATVLFAKTLLAGAKKLKETVVATRDIMKVKELNSQESFYTVFDDETRDAVLDCLGTPSSQAEVLIKSFNLESTTVPAMIRYMAKMDLIGELQDTAETFLQMLYEDQKIASVIAKTAKPLTDAQVTALKNKLKVKLQVEDIKLKNVIDESLISGYILEYNFMDEDKMENPMQTVDASYLAQLSAVTY